MTPGPPAEMAVPPIAKAEGSMGCNTVVIPFTTIEMGVGAVVSTASGSESSVSGLLIGEGIELGT